MKYNDCNYEIKLEWSDSNGNYTIISRIISRDRIISVGDLLTWAEHLDE